MVAFDHGSIPEIVEPGVTGFIVADMASAILAASRVDRLDRTLIRSRFEDRFSVERMVDDYLDVYRALYATSSPALGPERGFSGDDLTL